jgi:sortase (surface protein transpeptidase)
MQDESLLITCRRYDVLRERRAVVAEMRDKK